MAPVTQDQSKNVQDRKEVFSQLDTWNWRIKKTRD